VKIGLVFAAECRKHIVQATIQLQCIRVKEKEAQRLLEGELMITVGIDVGSITAKAAAIKDGELVSHRLIFTGYNTSQAGRNVFESMIKELGIKPDAIDKIVSTGYGRKSVAIADKAVTEITCHAAGAHYLNPAVRSVIDIGGQDSKAIAMDGAGAVVDFAMNEKCAAGTGRFLEVMARALELDLDDFGPFSLKAFHPSKISSLCTVFAESEVISLISQGEQRENIIAGIHESIAARVVAMVNRVGLKIPIMMTGGVAKNIGVVKALEIKIGEKIEISPKAQLTGAIGAAILAQRE
jgi:predicted CoA-substrate-specific enzyme activase